MPPPERYIDTLTDKQMEKYFTSLTFLVQRATQVTQIYSMCESEMQL